MGAAVDPTLTEEFTRRMGQVLNDAALGYLLSIGHQTGLFDALADARPTSAADLADRTGLDPRYVREWLDGAVAGRVLDLDPASGTYRLPPEHAASLTRAAGSANVAASAGFLAMFGTVENDVVACFRDGGGIPYSRYPAFHALMSESSAANVDAGLLSRVLPLAPGLTARLESGIDVLDVGCGSGHAVIVMAAAFPASHFTGVDLSPVAIERATREAEFAGLSNVSFGVVDLVDVNGKYDVITGFDVVHDQVRPREALARIRDALRPGGLFFCMDIAASSDASENIDHPMGPWLYTFSLFHCMTVSLAEGGEGLGSMWGEDTALEYLRDAGFSVEGPLHVDGDPVHAYYLCAHA